MVWQRHRSIRCMAGKLRNATARTYVWDRGGKNSVAVNLHAAYFIPQGVETAYATLNRGGPLTVVV